MSSQVYFLRNWKTGAIKIGYSKRPEKRVSMIADAPASDVYLIGWMPGGREEEQKLHRLFAAERIPIEYNEHGIPDKGREWFSPSDHLLTFIRQNVVKSEFKPPKQVSLTEASRPMIVELCGLLELPPSAVVETALKLMVETAKETPDAKSGKTLAQIIEDVKTRLTGEMIERFANWRDTTVNAVAKAPERRPAKHEVIQSDAVIAFLKERNRALVRRNNELKSQLGMTVDEVPAIDREEQAS